MIPISNEDFIALVEQRPVLWDKTSKYYLNKVATLQAWHEIVLAMYPDCNSWNAEKRKESVRIAIKKWKYLRDTLMYSERKIKHEKKIGNRQSLTKPYCYRPEMSFLLTPKNTGVSVDESDDDEAISYLKDQDTSENTNNSQVQPNTSNVIRKRISTGDCPVEAKMIRSVDSFSLNPGPADRLVSFFNGLLPTLEQFNDDQTIDFQLGVMQLVKSIKCPIQCEVILPAELAQDLLPCKVEIE